LELGILGGTFDPIHLGHLRTAEEIGQRLCLEKVYLIPSASPPHKDGNQVTPFQHRLAMTRLAAEESPLIEALDIEGRRPGPSYSVETLKELHRMFGPEPTVYFILGLDAFLELRTWREYQRLFEYAHFVVISRTGYAKEDAGPLLLDLGFDGDKGKQANLFSGPDSKTLRFEDTTIIDISSTRIREMVFRGRSLRFLVPESVKEYISREGLYRKA
jgi:nicotinate-nucleotide adenylyltransferase